MSAAYGTAGQGFGAQGTGDGIPRWLTGIVGGLTAAVGIAALAWPGPTLLAVGIMFGGYFAFWGVVLMVRGVGGAGVAPGVRVLDVLLGMLAVLVGLALIARPGASIQTAAWVLGFWWALVGALQVVRGIVVPVGRVWNLVWGVIGLAVGIIILASPEIALGTLVLLVGIGLILQGALELLLAFSPADGVGA